MQSWQKLLRGTDYTEERDNYSIDCQNTTTTLSRRALPAHSSDFDSSLLLECFDPVYQNKKVYSFITTLSVCYIIKPVGGNSFLEH